MSKIKGIYAASMSVINKDLTLDVKKTIEHAEMVIDQGCHGMAIFGSTGQAQLIPVAEKINLLAGPSLYYSMESDDSDKTRFNLDLGGSYDITENFFVEPRYSLGLTGDFKVNHLLLGVGYKF